MSPTLKSAGMSDWGKIWEGTVGQILARSGGNIGLSYVKEIVNIFGLLITMHERDRLQNGNDDTNRQNCF